MNEGFKVVELFAAMGFDSSELEQGLGNSTIQLAQFEKAITGLQRHVFQSMTPAFQAASNAVQQMTARNNTYAQSLDIVKGKLLDYLRVEQSRAELVKLMQADSAKQEVEKRSLIGTGSDVVTRMIDEAGIKRTQDIEATAAAEAMRIRRKMRAERKAEDLADVASRKEYQSLKEKLAAEEKAATAAREAEEEKAFQAHMQRLRRLRAQIKDEQKEESYLYRQKNGLNPGGGSYVDPQPATHT